MHQDLEHLSSSEIDTLIQRYYKGESVKKLLSEYNISVRTSDLYKLFPPEVYEDYICDYCSDYLVLDRVSKSMSSIDRYKNELYCPVCSHRPFDPNCCCNTCIDKKKQLKHNRLIQIKECYSKPRETVNFDTLPFTIKVYLGAICRALLCENLYEIMSYESQQLTTPLVPSNSFRKEIYDALLEYNVIKVSPRSPIEAFVLEDDFPNTFYTYKVIYELNLTYPSNKQDLYTEILNPTYYSDEYAEEALNLWRHIAVTECVEYLLYQLNKVRFNFSAGDKTFKTFEILLDDFSVSQIYGIIWKAVADASKMCLEKNITRDHAANIVIGACQRYAERAKMNHWDLTGYQRIRDLPQSTLSMFYFNRVLQIGDMGFTMPPTIV